MPYTCRTKTVYFHGEDKGIVQDYLIIRKECNKKNLFVDAQFPANDSSLYFNKKPDDDYIWLRPHQINDDPKFIVDGTSRFDVKQGGLGDCWMLAGMVNLTTNPRLWSFVVPNKQDFGDDYAGVFHFRLWRQGDWVDVVVDDYLPTLDGQLGYVTSTTGNEFWSALLEKAYAKIFGSYEAIEGGQNIESMTDFSGGIPEAYIMKGMNPNPLFEIMHKARLQNAWLGCGTISVSDEVDNRNKRKYGLVAGHAYTVTDVRRVKFENEPHKQKLVRVRNPWGENTEWKGDYKDKSDKWNTLSAGERQKLKLDFKHDGEYWMHFRDFMKHFADLSICHQSEDIFSDEPGQFNQYLVNAHHGSWNLNNGTAGGGPSYKKTFKHNPQYRVTLVEPDEKFEYEEGDDDSETEKGECTLIVSLMLKNRRKLRTQELDFVKIGFVVYNIPDPENWPKAKLQNRFLNSHEPVYVPDEFSWFREDSSRLSVEPGTYLIIPCTEEAEMEGEFLLRILTEKPSDCQCVA